MVYVFVASGMERRLRAAYGPDAGHRGRWQMGGELDGVEVVPPIALEDGRWEMDKRLNV